MKRFYKICLGLVLVFGGLAIISGADILVGKIMKQVYASDGQKIVTIYDKNHKQTILTNRSTVSEVLEQAEIKLGKFDIVEPELGAEVSDGFNVNIFRARPLTVIDGELELNILTPYQLASDIAKHAGIELFPEDEAYFSTNPLTSGVGVGSQMVIERATVFSLNLFGKQNAVRTRKATVEEFLTEKGIALNQNEHMNLSSGDKIHPGMELVIWQEGEQEIVSEEEIDFSVRKVFNHNKPTGYREIEQAGVKGKRVVTYKINIRNGQEISRVALKTVVISEPKEQVEVIGAYRGQGLTMSKGVYQFTDSNGVTHRETYYDLPMNVVMRNCGAGGKYTVRDDGVKIDGAGYVIIAAHLGNYPRCSVVETSLGPGRVYDTGTFTSKHPHGFDIATDWTKRDGI